MNATIIDVLALTSSLLVFVCLGMTIFVLRSKKFRQPPAISESVSSTVTRRPEIKATVMSCITRSASVSFQSPMATCPISVKTFLLTQLEKVTDRFSSRNLLDEGGSSRVYHGIMEDGCEVAVKLLKRLDQDTDRECKFITKVEMLSRLHHRNLVKLIGICIEGHRRCLVYELIRNGSVKSHLHGPFGKVMLLPKDDPKGTHIMIATGTGIAPFCGYLGCMFMEVVPTYHFNGLAWLFLGVANTDSLLYDDDFSSYLDKYFDNFRYDRALNREKKNRNRGKMYIQDKIEEYNDEIFKLLDKEAHIYFCGLRGMMLRIQEMLKIVAEERGRIGMRSSLSLRRTSSGMLKLTNILSASSTPMSSS